MGLDVIMSIVKTNVSEQRTRLILATKNFPNFIFEIAHVGSLLELNLCIIWSSDGDKKSVISLYFLKQSLLSVFFLSIFLFLFLLNLNCKLNISTLELPIHAR